VVLKRIDTMWKEEINIVSINAQASLLGHPESLTVEGKY
jgi:uncharacterized NAD-dependent epimerase/dehydratase family protein